MELTEFAHRILCSSDLNEKLLTADEFSDEQPFHAVNLPSQPGRPSDLALGRWKTSSKVAFPSRADLLDQAQIGVLLHFFANHELLALELMALALLKFPNAPAGFRMGVARTMCDEQRHLVSYITRMKRFGVELGDIPVNDFFWSQCASMSSPMDYVSRMSLTFEQANLDFAAYFRDVLQDIGELDTAELLQTVLDDEIGHVKHGLTWFRRWKSESQTDWQAFCCALGVALNPARAKGTVFCAEHRKAAGFDDDYIDSLKVFSQSKGRLPRIAFFNPEAEEEIRLGGLKLPALGDALKSAKDDLAPLMIHVASQDDVVLVSRELPREFLLSLRSAGFSLPEFLQTPLDGSQIKVHLKERKIAGCLPWAITPFTLQFEKKLKTDSALFFNGAHDSLRQIYSKATAIEILNDFLQIRQPDARLVGSRLIGKVVHNPDEFENALAQFADADVSEQFIAKRPWSASGRHRLTGKLSAKTWNEQPEQVRQWFEKAWRIGEAPVVQPFFKRRLDLSVQGRIDSSHGSAVVHGLGFTRVLNLPQGQYAGSCVGRFLSGVEADVVRFFHKGSANGFGTIEQVLNDLLQYVGNRLSSYGLSGAFGIDAFIFEKPDRSLALFPLIEVNPRHTMGRVAVALSRRMAPGRVGVCLHVPKQWLERFAVENFSELRNRWSERMPLTLQTRSGGTVILSGLLETTPAEQCAQVWTCFVVGQSLEEVVHKLSLDEVLKINEAGPKVDRLESQP